MNEDVEKRSDHDNTSRENTLVGEDEHGAMAVGETRTSWRHSAALTSSSRGVSPHTPIPYPYHSVPDTGISPSMGVASDISQPQGKSPPDFNKSGTARITLQNTVLVDTTSPLNFNHKKLQTNRWFLGTVITSAQPNANNIPTHRKRSSVRLVPPEGPALANTGVSPEQQNWVTY